MIIVETLRLSIRHLTAADTGFTVQLLNDPDFISNIADRGIRTEAEALQYLLNGPLESYCQHGYGLFLVEHAETKRPLGFCGLLYRDNLQETDIGFAFLPQYRGYGYAMEAAKAILLYGYQQLELSRIVGLVSPQNKASINLLNKLGLRFEKHVQLSADKTQVMLFS